MSRKHRLIDVMIKDNMAVLYINDNAYVSEDTVKNNSLIRKMVSGAEAFKYDYLAEYAVDNVGKEIASNIFSGKYVVRFNAADKHTNLVTA